MARPISEPPAKYRCGYCGHWAAWHGDYGCRGWHAPEGAATANRCTCTRTQAEAEGASGLHACEGCGLELDGDDPSTRCCECVDGGSDG